MPREVAKRLRDMLKAAKEIQFYCLGRTIEQLATDSQFRSAIYFQFIILGEALASIRDEDESVYDSITDNFRIVGYRNLVVHGYFRLDDDVAWDIIHEGLPILIAELEALAASH